MVPVNKSGSSAHAYRWLEVRLQDSAGNYINYEYVPSSDDPGRSDRLLQSARFTGKLSQTSAERPPYAEVSFEYEASAFPRIVYVAGSQYRYSKRLKAVRSSSEDESLRYYRMRYLDATVSGRRADALEEVIECDRPDGAICLAPTVFQWSAGRHEINGLVDIDALRTGSENKFEGVKFGDVDGDGRADLVWIKDGVNGDVCTTDTLHVHFNRLDGQGNVEFVDSGVRYCLPELDDLRVLQDPTDPDPPTTTDSSWFLLDYTGDGRDDLFYRVAVRRGDEIVSSSWRGIDLTEILALESTPFVTDLLADLYPPIETGSSDSAEHQPQIADLNGDGLSDIVWFSDGEYRVRLMERTASGFAWGSVRTIVLNGYAPCQSQRNSPNSCWKPIGLHRKQNYQQVNDFNGDARSDLLLVTEVTLPHACAVPDPDDPLPPVQPFQNRSPTTNTCVIPHVVAFVVEQIGESTITARLYPGGVWSNAYFRAVSFADVNGDGLTELINHNETIGVPIIHKNYGDRFASEVSPILGADSANSVWSGVLLVRDFDGDGRADVAYPYTNPDPNGSKADDYTRLVMRRALGDGSFGPEEEFPGGGVETGCEHSNVPAMRACVQQKSFLFGDHDGDGAIDLVRLNFDGSSSVEVKVGMPSLRWIPRDVIVGITGGLADQTGITYLPLNNREVYLADAGARDPAIYGRGSPVSNVYASAYVVAKVATSAPTWVNPGHVSSLYYRYAGLKLQAGGRGSLGFREVHTIDTNYEQAYVETVTRYHQSFPLTGRGWMTERFLVPAAYFPGNCFFPSAIRDDCFVARGGSFAVPGNARFLSASESEWEAIGFAQGPPVTPVRVRLAGTSDRSFDPEGNLLSRIETSYQYDDWDNATFTEVRTYGEDFVEGIDPPPAPGPVSTVTTTSIYDNDGERWRLGRLSDSTVVHSREGQPSITRCSSFEYDLENGGASTGLLTMEQANSCLPPRDSLKTYYVLDEFGNRVRTHTCSADVSEAACKSTSVAFEPADPMRVHRYQRTEFDQGRFVASEHSLFATGEERTFAVLHRDQFGNVVRSVDVNNVLTERVIGALGRAYAERTLTAGNPETGPVSVTSYRWCGTSAGDVSCPAGAAYRVQAYSSVKPARWTYHDMLARPFLSVSEAFDSANPGDELVATCIGYDARGRTSRQSEPFFLGAVTSGVRGQPGYGPVIAGAPCQSGSVLWTQTSYDELDRVTEVRRPDNATVTYDFDGLVTTIKDPLLKERVEQRNPMGELVSVADDYGTTVAFSHDSTGNLRTITRQAADGDLVTEVQYDQAGRRKSLLDADSGLIEFFYNAAGDLVEERRFGGARTLHRYDARGRVFKTQVFAEGGASPETTSHFAYDSAPYGVGLPTTATITGRYAGWSGSGLDHSYLREYRYDSFGRTSGTTTWIEGVSYETAVEYDRLGRPWKEQDASGRWLQTEYNERGFVRALCESFEGAVLATCSGAQRRLYQETLAVDPRGNLQRERRGGNAGFEMIRSFDHTTGRLLSISAGEGGNLQSEEYRWDRVGNLLHREKQGQYREDFTYDDLHRLKSASFSNLYGQPGLSQSLSMEYDALGNVCSRTIGGHQIEYDYSGRDLCQTGPGQLPATAGPHAVTATTDGQYGYDSYGNQTEASWQGHESRFIRYSGAQQAYELALGNQAFPGARTRFWYGPDGQRYLREDDGPGMPARSIVYLGNVEVVLQGGQSIIRRYIGGVLVQEVEGETATDRYLLHDHLGSVVRTVTLTGEGAGAHAEGMDFGAFGERRGYMNPWGTPQPTQATERGFTGHEMLDAFGVIHMNGRLYDPRLGRFLQPDAFVQEPGNLQNYNRYTYLWNNPLNATDPTGHLGIRERQWLGVIITVAAVATQQYWAADFGAGLSGATAAAAKASGTAMVYAGVGAVSGGIATQSWSGAAWGAFSSMAFSGIGGSFGPSSQWWARGLGMGATGGALSVLQGGKFGHGFLSAGASAAAGPALQQAGRVRGTVLSALLGGSVSAATGGKFANGAVTAAMSYAFASKAQAQSEDARMEAELRAAAAYNYETALAWQPPSLPQGLVDFAAGFGDTLSWGLTQYVRNWADIGSVDYDSGAYTGGQVAGVAHSTVLGGAFGLRLAGSAGKGMEFSHWIPNRWGGPRSLFNGNYVTTAQHALSDPYRYRFMPRAWKLLNPMPSVMVQQWNRIPYVWKGTAAGAAYGGAGAGSGGGG